MVPKLCWSSVFLTGLLLISSSVFAYVLNGSLDRDDSVTLYDNQGHIYFGYSENEEDGTLNITVQDDRRVTYSGIATEISNGKYSLDLENDNGGSATGILEEK